MDEKEINKKSIFNSYVFIAILLLFLIKPAYFSEFLWINKLYKYAGLAITSIAFVYSTFYTKKSFATIWYYIFFGIILISTIFNDGNTYAFFNSILPTFGLCLLFDIYLKKNPKALFKAFTVLEIYIYINIITILLFNNGMYKSGVYYENWFLGYKNIQIRTILPIVCMSMINSYIVFDKINIRTMFLLIISAVTFILIKSSTALVGFSVFLLLFYKYHKVKKKIPKILSVNFFLLITSILFYIISVLKLQNLFEFFIVGILHKDLSFNGRMKIWDMAFSFLKTKPFLGYGYLTGEDFQKIFNSFFYTHPHNYYLYILMTGGIVLLIALIIGLLYANKSIIKSNNKIYSRIVLFTIISFLVMGITESITSTVLLYPIFVLAMNCNEISNL